MRQMHHFLCYNYIFFIWNGPKACAKKTGPATSVARSSGKACEPELAEMGRARKARL